MVICHTIKKGKKKERKKERKNGEIKKRIRSYNECGNNRKKGYEMVFL
jgi:hypothetical protein